MAKDRQEIIAVLDLHLVGQHLTPQWASYREVIADALMALPDVGDEPLRELLSYCRQMTDAQPASLGGIAEMAYIDVAARLTGILDGEG